ncbi:hypothetical protein [Streptomyces sp. NPDC051219]
MPATGAFASSENRDDFRCSDWGGWDDRRHCDFFDRDGRNFNDVVIILVG